MSGMGQFLKAWKVRSIEALPDNRGVEVTFGVEGRDPIRFRTRRFGIGKRGARSAALAKFAAQAGYGDAKFIYDYLRSLPRGMVGPIFAVDLLPLQEAPRDASIRLRCFWPTAEAT